MAQSEEHATVTRKVKRFEPGPDHPLFGQHLGTCASSERIGKKNN